MTEKGSSKDCGHHGHTKEPFFPFFPHGKHFRRWMGCLIVLIVIVLLVILIVYLALHPQKPLFNVQDATVRELNLTEGLLTSSLQFSIVSHNPNDNIGIYYDSLNAYASYQNQQITPICSLSPFYQGTNCFNVLSPILYGNSISLASFVANDLIYDTQKGLLSLTLTMYGRIRWKVGSWTSGHYHLNVNCYCIMEMTNNSIGGQVSLQPGTRCQVNFGG
jgi:hypothetical protein